MRLWQWAAPNGERHTHEMRHARMRRSESTYDAIVVGSGASGSWAVKELMEGGLKVVPFDPGRSLDIAHDFLPTQRWA